MRLIAAPITTNRLLLRPPVMADAGRITELLGNWNVARMLGAPPFPYRLEDAEEWLLRLPERERGGESDHRVIDCDGALCGCITIEPRPRGQVLGYWLGESYWGRGLMSEAALAYVHAFFAVGRYDRLASGALVDNPASLRILEKVGFERMGESMMASRPRGHDVRHVDMLLRRERFQALHP